MLAAVWRARSPAVVRIGARRADGCFDIVERLAQDSRLAPRHGQFPESARPS